MHQSEKINFSSVNLIEVDNNSKDRRLDNFLISILHGVPRSHIYNLIRTGQVRVNSGRAKVSRRLKAGDRVRVPPVATHSKKISGEITPVIKNALDNVIFEDGCIVVLDKPAGVAVHAGTRHNLGLIEAMKLVRKEEPDIQLVHRLDKDTSGILILAKNMSALRYLQAQWRRDENAPTLTKNYLALIKGNWNNNPKLRVESELTIDDHRSKRQQPVVALSYFSPISSYKDCVLVNIELHTGKTHQARQHAQKIGQPIAGDRKYGDRDFNRLMHGLGLKRMFLHASNITITHPESERRVSFESSLPQELSGLIETLNHQEEVLE